jgi:hypothetical protein
MARGDVQAVWHISLASNGTHDIQPGSGDEWMLSEMLGDKDACNNMEGGDGSNFTGVFETIFPGASSGASEAPFMAGGKQATSWSFYMTNGEFIRIINQSGTTQVIGYGALETK